jgi:dTDP-4-dehydrorhamnose reductase
MLGSAIFSSLIENRTFEIFTLGRKETQKLQDKNQYIFKNSDFILDKKPNIEVDYIIHCAANTNLNSCESDPRVAINVNVQMVELLNQFATLDTHLFYVSTDSVFDGRKGNYVENDKTNPLNNYAKTKLKGESRARESFIGKSTIVRTNIFGFNVPLKNSLVEWALNEWKLNKKISGYTNVYFNAIYIGHLANILKEFIHKNSNFDYINVASSNFTSKFDFLNELRKEFGYSEELLMDSTYNFESQTLKRPLDTTLNTELLASIMSVPTVELGIRKLKEDWNLIYEN